ncbi:helix-turn-helix transcriptional regulator (plasmid) [Rhizobium sp. CB3171]|uniref:helix-turn-helix domain-containing protein n=1 Tax=unclassified Rhizobium TaxID=2613769 RepID=UPI000CDF4CCF|nr:MULTISPECIES: helix-turn-helix transcriptional regulator [Rhizobium]AVA25052.1 XRE family transcriptional regulator protein [Rhizobium sp. NXC24]UWU24841.1 helix-turn-helix domain-containing protein [Rhizobium tropici]WFU04274.1 helix-turn-helix transcriptional regulator [Rhizobium sp. CB3171]
MSISLNNFNEVPPQAVHADDVAARVKAARETVGYSIEDLAVTCGLANEEIIGIEDGADIDPAKLKRIANALQLPPSAFLAV